MERRFFSQGWQGSWAHGLLCLALLLGSVDLHSADATHEPLALSSGSVYYPAAAHPGQPAHIEQADPVQHPHCAACLLRLQTRGACLQPAGSILPADLTFRLCLAPAPSAALVARRSSGARAPPLS